jgi:ubiquinol-cytochrome c reductase iron-sulfur subunit
VAAWFAVSAGGSVGLGVMLAGPFVEERRVLAATPEERRAAEEDLEREELPRRRFLVRMLIAAGAALGAALLFPVRSLGPSPGDTLLRSAWRRGMRLVTPEGQPVAAAAMQVGSVLTVFPEGRTDAADSQAVLIRVDPAALTPPPGRGGWAPDGNVAYSKICTHAGCPVGLYEDRTGQLFCPCHQSVFDALDGARPLAGPAARPLPQLRLEIDEEGYLRAGGDFSAPVGPATWDVP